MSLKACIVALNFVNYDGITNLNNRVVELSTHLKKFVCVRLVKAVFFIFF